LQHIPQRKKILSIEDDRQAAELLLEEFCVRDVDVVSTAYRCEQSCLGYSSTLWEDDIDVCVTNNIHALRIVVREVII
jgi:hypothetical protein